MKLMENSILFWWWVEFVILAIWQAPQNIIALLMMPFLGKKTLKRVDRHAFAYEAENMSGAISLGSFIFLSKSNAKKETSIRHELGHCWDSHLMGPLYLLIIGIPSVLHAWLSDCSCYYEFYTEAWANKHAPGGVKVHYTSTGGCYLVLPEES